MEVQIDPPPKRRGLKPGQRHSGQFQKGHDPKRNDVRKYANGETFRKLCMAKTPEALKLISEIMDDPKEDSKVRLAAAIHILDRGYGKPVSGVALLGAGSNSDPSKLTSAELDALIAKALQSSGEEMNDDDDADALDGEYEEVSSG